VLVADLADAASRDFLAGLAVAGGKAYLPLVCAPGSTSTHLLEVYTPGSVEPLVLFAEPLGAPTAVGFPLLLRSFEPTAHGSPEPEKSETLTQLDAPGMVPGADELRPRVPTNVALTSENAGGLDGVAEDSPEAFVGRAIAGGKLVIEALLGAGGMGAVYRASHRDLRMPVAVKVLHKNFQNDMEFCRRFHSEALAASRLDHPNLMRVLDFGQEPDGILYLAMEHLNGRALADTLSAGVGLPLPRIVGIVMQVCAGLAHAHARGIVHRDIKPDNVVLVANTDDDERPDEMVKVCDFGIAVADADGEQSAAVVGTPDYMSPEQCRGQVLDGRSDVYACGVMLYELASGHMPFSAATPGELLNHHMYTPAPRVRLVAPQVDPRLEAIIAKAMSKDPASRHASMRDLRRDLRLLLDGEAEGPNSLADPSSSPREASASGRFSREPETRPDWLEQGGGYWADNGEAPTGPMLELATVEAKVVTAVMPAGQALADELAARPGPWLLAFAGTVRTDAFEALATRLEAALPLLMAARQVKGLFAIRCTLDELATDDGAQPRWRIARARLIQKGFADPAVLGMLAETALGTERADREFVKLLVRAGTQGAYALYSARLKLKDVPGVRGRFVPAVGDFGVEALPMIRAGLARLEARRDVPVAADLAMDLLEASPRMRDDEAGEVTARYLQGAPLPLTRAAAEALVYFWGPRSTPLLLGLLVCEDDAIRLACIRGLRALRAVDEYAVPRIVFAARASRSQEVHAAARQVLSETTGEARVAAQRALAQPDTARRDK
jgi:serine/threonine-protein kinase